MTYSTYLSDELSFPALAANSSKLGMLTWNNQNEILTQQFFLIFLPLPLAEKKIDVVAKDVLDLLCVCIVCRFMMVLASS